MHSLGDLAEANALIVFVNILDPVEDDISQRGKSERHLLGPLEKLGIPRYRRREDHYALHIGILRHGLAHLSLARADKVSSQTLTQQPQLESLTPPPRPEDHPLIEWNRCMISPVQ